MTVPCLTAGGRPAYVVNVSVLLRRDGRWLLIRRGAGERHAPGSLGDVGGKVDAGAADGPDVLESTARREVLEEVGLDLTGVPLRFAESSLFTTDDGDPVVNVLFAADLPDGPQPRIAAPEEVASFAWLTLAEASATADCPPWTLRELRAAVEVLTA
jgi:8-oxo-dGTP pyrophosphatase MutT (NUDIX family)